MPKKTIISGKLRKELLKNKRDKKAANPNAIYGDEEAWGDNNSTISNINNIMKKNEVANSEKHINEVEETKVIFIDPKTKKQLSDNNTSNTNAAAKYQIDTLGRSARTDNSKDRRTFFRREDPAILAERKKLAHLAVRRLDKSGIELSPEYFLQKNIIDFPHRPTWNIESKVSLESRENKYFEDYLNNLYTTYGETRLNYFEHNLEVWRQLWRTCEMSDILLLLVDIRHPFFHFPIPLYNYITETLKKPLVLVLNKVDLVPSETITLWTEFFKTRFSKLVHIIPFSVKYGDKHNKSKKGHTFGANDLINFISQIPIKKSINWDLVKEEVSKLQVANEFVKEVIKQLDSDSYDSNEEVIDISTKSNRKNKNIQLPQKIGSFKKDRDLGKPIDFYKKFKKIALTESEESESNSDSAENFESEVEEVENKYDNDTESVIAHKLANSTAELEEYWEEKFKNLVTVGLIGHPNVGKSSVINGLVAKHVVSTSRTPGHTKHFQHIPITKEFRLMDCPGLVFPALDVPKQLQVLMSIYPIAQVQEPYYPIQYLAERVAIEDIYKLKVKLQSDEDYQCAIVPGPGTVVEGEWSAFTFCFALAEKKKFFTKRGARPDTHRAAIFILKDVVDGNVVLSFLPPKRELWPVLE